MTWVQKSCFYAETLSNKKFKVGTCFGPMCLLPRLFSPLFTTTLSSLRNSEFICQSNGSMSSWKCHQHCKVTGEGRNRTGSWTVDRGLKIMFSLLVASPAPYFFLCTFCFFLKVLPYSIYFPFSPSFPSLPFHFFLSSSLPAKSVQFNYLAGSIATKLFCFFSPS